MFFYIALLLITNKTQNKMQNTKNQQIMNYSKKELEVIAYSQCNKFSIIYDRR